MLKSPKTKIGVPSSMKEDSSHSPNQGVAQLLSTPFTMAETRFSPEWGQNGCDSPSPYDHDGRINDGLGHGLRRQTGARGMDRRVPFLAHKLPGTQGCLPGFDAFSPRSWEASYNSQNAQYGGRIPHKPSPWTGSRAVFSFGPRTSSFPWGQFTFWEYWTLRPIFCRDRNSGRENACWTVRRYPRFRICLAKQKWTCLLLKSL